MKLFIKKMGVQETIDGIMMFQTDENTQYWREPLFFAFPNLDKPKGLFATWPEREPYLRSELKNIYVQEESKLDAKTKEFIEY
jgi:hypothetical protein